MFIPTLPEMFKTKSQFKGTTRLWEVWMYHGYGRESEYQRKINLSPKYQRPDVWTDAQRCAFIRSIFFGLPIPPLVLNANSWEKEQETGFWFNVIDGKQRLTTIFKFVHDELEVDGFKWSQIDPRARQKFNSHPLSAIETHFETEEEEAEYYEVFNYAGTAHTPVDTYTLDEILWALSSISSQITNRFENAVNRDEWMSDESLYLSENALWIEQAIKTLPRVLLERRKVNG